MRISEDRKEILGEVKRIFQKGLWIVVLGKEGKGKKHNFERSNEVKNKRKVRETNN